MTQAQAPTPPGKTKAANAPAPSKKAASKASDAADGAEKKPRAPRKDYGYAATSIIHTVSDPEKEAKFTGARKTYHDLLVQYDGKTVNDFEQAWPTKDDSPRGWIRFFCQNGNITLERVKAAEPVKEEKKEKADKAKK